MIICRKRTILQSVQSSPGNAGLGVNEPRARAMAARKCQKWVVPRYIVTRTASRRAARSKSGRELGSINLRIDVVVALTLKHLTSSRVINRSCQPLITGGRPTENFNQLDRNHVFGQKLRISLRFRSSHKYRQLEINPDTNGLFPQQ